MRYTFLIITLLAGGFVQTGCGGTKVATVKPGPAIAGVNLSGRWFSPEFGEMTVVHSGPTISGKYADRRGPDHNGRFRGQIVGDLIRLEWIKPGNAIAAIMPRRGRAWLRIVNRGAGLSGRWGFDQSEDDGGIWRAEKSTDR